MSGTTSDDDEEAIGLTFLFGHDRWVPSGTNTDTPAFKIRFETLVAGGSIDGDALMKQIPSGLANKFEIEARTQRGFKFEWNDTAGVPWHVHGHEPDAGAKAGHIGAARWICRISYNNKFWLVPAMIVSNFPDGHANFQPPTMWTPSKNKNKARDTHVPLDA